MSNPTATPTPADDFVLTLPGEGSAQAAILLPVDGSAVQGDPYNVLKMVTEDAVNRARVKIAKMVDDDDTFTLDFVKALIDSYPISAIPNVKALLSNTALRATGELGSALSTKVKVMQRVEGNIPEFPEKWSNAISNLSAKPTEMVKWARSLQVEIQAAIRGYQDAQEPFNKVDQILGDQENLMKEGRVRNDKTSLDEKRRSKQLRDLCITLTLTLEEMDRRIAEIQDALKQSKTDALKDELQKLADMKPIIENALGTLVPYIEQTANNAAMFIGQRNDDALTEWQLHIFRGPGMAQWEVNFTIKLQALQTKAARMELAIANDALLKSGDEADEAYIEQMKAHAAAFSEFQTELERVRKRTQVLIQAGQILEQGVRDARKKKDGILREVQKSYEEREATQQRWIEVITESFGSAPATEPVAA